ncbi:lytic murein transglycosylase [bacterium]|nr:lytic murein transglycosylase [bacterium]
MRNIHKIYGFLVIVLVILSSSFIYTNKFALSTLELTGIAEKYEFFKPVINKLMKKGVDSAFIYQLLSDSSTYFNEKYVQISVPSYKPKKSSNSNDPNRVYPQFANDFSITQITKFIQDNYEILDKMEQKYSVSKDVVASLLWVESRYGSYLGNHNIVNVFLNQALVDETDFIEFNLKRLKEKYNPDEKETVELQNKLKARSKSKANFAINELVALYRLQDKLPYKSTELKGSYAGAFGISQFLPSSYSRWAVDGSGDGKIDLYDVNDAIFSAANYLANHGWKSDSTSQRKAVFAYNHSTVYVNTIFYLSQRVEDYQAKLFFLPLKFQILSF